MKQLLFSIHRLRGIALILLVAIVFSPQARAAAGWTSYGAVVELTPTTSGRFLVELAVSDNPSGCRDKAVFYRDYTGMGADHMYQLLLAAVTDSKRVRVYVTGNCDHRGYSEITSAAIIP